MKAYTTPVLSVLIVEDQDLLTTSPMSVSNNTDCGYTPWDDIVNG